MSDDHQSPPGKSDPLDELLSRAKWPEPTPSQMARLEAAWDHCRPAARPESRPEPLPEPSRRLRFSAFSGIAAGVVAATVLAGLVIGNALLRQPDVANDVPVLVKETLERRLPVVEPPVIEPSVIEPSVPVLDDRISRPPTWLELALLRVAEQRASRLRQWRETDPLERALTRLVGDPHVDISELVPPPDDVDRFVERIIAELPRSRGQRRMALARLLTTIEPPDSLPALLSLWSDPATRELVEPTVVRLADLETLTSLLRSRLTFADRVRLLAAIVSRPEIEAHKLLVAAAMEPQTRPAALAVARKTSPPTELLFAALADENANVRVAAALLLGVHRDPQVTDGLIEIARKTPARSEPWIALMQRDDAAARRIIEEARRHPQIMVSVNSAEATRQMMMHPVRVGVPL